MSVTTKFKLTLVTVCGLAGLLVVAQLGLLPGPLGNPTENRDPDRPLSLPGTVPREDDRTFVARVNLCPEAAFKDECTRTDPVLISIVINGELALSDTTLARTWYQVVRVPRGGTAVLGASQVDSKWLHCAWYRFGANTPPIPTSADVTELPGEVVCHLDRRFTS